MSEDATPSDAVPGALSPNRLIAEAYGGLDGLSQRLARAEERLAAFARTKDRAIMSEARRLRRQVREFEPAVTMIGQVKAGKTTLTNAMVGWPALLPADVNPWTSVVTSLHLVPRTGRGAGRASFQFFSEDGWNHLLKSGGRVGELASRAGADEEVDKVRRQLEEMREKSRSRLGRHFEMMLGQSHDYSSFDEKLIERYVCLGDDFWEDSNVRQSQGRFADITKSADLWLARSELPVGLCIRDTPGVNDTFMVREQITIRALRGSRTCVLVLSAQQALTSVDLALVRLIANVKSRDVIIFVNRIDELADPAREVPEIRASIVETLKRHDGPADAEILFGSGFWAEHALRGTYDSLGQDSAKSLLNWAEANVEPGAPCGSVEDVIWSLSGVPALGAAIASRIEAEAAAGIEAKLERGLRNLEQAQAAVRAVQNRKTPPGKAIITSPEKVLANFDSIAREAQQDLDQRFRSLQESFATRVDNARQSFLSRATKALVRHLEVYGEKEVWTYDPTGLRILLRSGYAVFVKSANTIGEDTMARAASQIGGLYRIAGNGGEVTLDPPPLPDAPPPVVLGQTIALDLSGGWWNRFWRRYRGYHSYVETFSKLIFEETQPIADALRTDNAEAFEQAMRTTLTTFLDGQRAIIEDIVRASERPPATPETARAAEPDMTPDPEGRGPARVSPRDPVATGRRGRVHLIRAAGR